MNKLIIQIKVDSKSALHSGCINVTRRLYKRFEIIQMLCCHVLFFLVLFGLFCSHFFWISRWCSVYFVCFVMCMCYVSLVLSSCLWVGCCVDFACCVTSFMFVLSSCFEFCPVFGFVVLFILFVVLILMSL